jgi:hypothetical protein
MRINKIILAAVALLVSSQAVALNPTGFKVKTTSHLAELCGVSVNDPLYEAAMGFCFGYIDAALDYHAALTEVKSRDPLTCPPSDVTREEVVVVVTNWSQGNSYRAGRETPVHGVMRAVSAKWPCK